MSKVINCKKKKNIKRKNSSGFTLVELLATIAILSIVSVIVIYTATNVIASAKNKSYKVTINNIQKESNTYVLENNKDINWVSFNDGSNSSYQCVKVQNLIDMGYFDNNILDSKIAEDRNVFATDYVYIEMDNATKTITKQVLLYDKNSELYKYCSAVVDLDKSAITSNVLPKGWAKSKDVTITYKLGDNNIAHADNYKYGYIYNANCDINDDKNSCDKSFNFTTSKIASIKVTVFKEVSFYTDIKSINNELVGEPHNFLVDKIDTVGPTIAIDENDIQSPVRGKVIIPLYLLDNKNDLNVDCVKGKEQNCGSGLNKNSINENNIKVSIGGKLLNQNEYDLTEKKPCVVIDNDVKSCYYDLKIEKYEYAGELVIEIEEDKIKDIVGNGNKKTVLETGIEFTNIYTISYNANGGEGSMEKTTCIYGMDCQLRGNIFTEKGYTYIDWNTKKDGTGISYDNQYKFVPFNLKDDIILYAQWKANTYTISYNYNGGEKGSSAPTSGIYDETLIINIPVKNVTITGNENGTGAMIGNATSKTQIFAGWTYSNGNTSTAEYGSSIKWSDPNFKVNNSKYFKNLRSTSGTVTLMANWTPVALKLPTISKIGYSCNWNTKADGSGTSYESGESYTPTANSSSSITVYARCTPYKVTIHYKVNGGTLTDGSSSTVFSVDNGFIMYGGINKLKTSIEYGATINSSGLSNYNYKDNFTVLRTEYDVKSDHEWKCLSGCTTAGKTYDQDNKNYTSSDFCDATNGDCTVVLGVNWVDIKSPTCKINVTLGSTTLNATCSDNSGSCSYYGWNSSYSGTNSTTKTISAIGTIKYYVKDAAGNKGSCSIQVANTTTKNTCPSGYSLCSTSSCQCYKYLSSTQTGSCKCRDKNSYGSTPGTCSGSTCKCPDSYNYHVTSNSCKKVNNYSYKSYASTTKVCASGYTKINDVYCYK